MKLVFKTLIAFLLLVVVLNYVVPDPGTNDKKAEVENYAKNNNPGAAENTLKPLLFADSMNIDLNYQYVSYHFQQPEYSRAGKSSHKRDDSEIIDYYEHMRLSSDSAKRDIGNYCRGLCYSYTESYSQAYDCYCQVKNKNLKYLNNSLGYFFKRLGADSAEFYLKKEIALRGNMESAVSNLAEIYLTKKQIDKMSILVQNKETSAYLSDSDLRKFNLLAGEYIPYLIYTYKSIFYHSNWVAIIICLLIALVWLGYLRYIDLFEPEKWYYIAFVFGLAILLNPLTLLLYDATEVYLNFTLTGNWWNDLLYCVFGVGLIEESVKLIPLLIFLAIFRKQIQEPIDYIIYACVSAIGFAFIENLIYIGHDGYQIVHGRALSAAVAHMGCSSIVAYGFVVARYKKQLNSGLPVFYALLAASFVHGIYDYWLLCDAVNFLSIASLLVLFLLIGAWNTIQTNALNNSPFFDKKKNIDEHRLRHYLFLGLIAILAMEYIIITISCGPEVGTRSLLMSLMQGGYIMYILLFTITQFKLQKQKWNQFTTKKP